MPSLDVTTWFAAIYSVALLGVAYAIDLLARRAARNVEGHSRGGFTYHESHDAWLCPEDQWLWPTSFDPENRVMRYRADPLVCNSCPVKDTCTFSDAGREIRRQVDPWPASEAARFHRGIACTVTVLAVVWPLATILSGPSTSDMIVLGTVTFLVTVGAAPLWAHLRRTPADPMGVLVKSSDEAVAERAVSGRAALSGRTRYRSDRLNPTDPPHGGHR